MLESESRQLIAVIPWPQTVPALLKIVNTGDNDNTQGLEKTPPLFVISVITPLTSIRGGARKQIRMALREVLGILLEMHPASVPLITKPGHPICLPAPYSHIGLSISHEPGLSIAAINLHGKVGTDLMRTGEIADWKQVAQEYLGPESYGRIVGLPASCQLTAFAQEWTRYEASLKCLGIGIREWDLLLADELRQCIVNPLTLPNGMVGTIATLPATPFSL